MSFHFGAGLDYLDTTARPQPEDRLRFKTSRNVDVWTPGVVKRLNGTTLTRRRGGAKVWVEPTSDRLDRGPRRRCGGLRRHELDDPQLRVGVLRSGRSAPTASTTTSRPDGVWTAPLSGTATATKVWTPAVHRTCRCASAGSSSG
jgi:hypothetical protein